MVPMFYHFLDPRTPLVAQCADAAAWVQLKIFVPIDDGHGFFVRAKTFLHARPSYSI